MRRRGRDDGVSPPADAARDGEGRRKAYIETYGCQMNVNDSEIVASVLASSDYDLTDALPDADAILVNTCAIRENAESKVWHRLRQLRAVKRDRERAARREAKRAMSDRSGVFVATPPRPPPVVGVLGCMGERLKEKILETDGLADLVAGPDAYRDLPRLIDAARGNAAVAADGGDVGRPLRRQRPALARGDVRRRRARAPRGFRAVRVRLHHARVR